MAGVYAIAELSMLDYHTPIQTYHWSPTDSVPISITVQVEETADVQWRQTRAIIWTIGNTLFQMIEMVQPTEVITEAYMGDELICNLVMRYASPAAAELLDESRITNATSVTAVRAIVPDDLILQCQWGTDPRQVVHGRTMAISMIGMLAVELAQEDANRKIFRGGYTLFGIATFITDSRGTIRNIRLRIKNVVWIVVRLVEQYVAVGHTQTMTGKALWDGEEIATIDVGIERASA